ncbi:MAG: hypothetical protein AAFR36_32810, partial [Bacteroidota bacterium]
QPLKAMPAEAPLPTPQKRVRIKSVVCCRNEQIKLYREARNGKIKIEDASRLAHILMQIGKSFEVTDLQHRIEVLEGEVQ